MTQGERRQRKWGRLSKNCAECQYVDFQQRVRNWICIRAFKSGKEGAKQSAGSVAHFSGRFFYFVGTFFWFANDCQGRSTTESSCWGPLFATYFAVLTSAEDNSSYDELILSIHPSCSNQQRCKATKIMNVVESFSACQCRTRDTCKNGGALLVLHLPRCVFLSHFLIYSVCHCNTIDGAQILGKKPIPWMRCFLDGNELLIVEFATACCEMESGIMLHEGTKRTPL